MDSNTQLDLYCFSLYCYRYELGGTITITSPFATVRTNLDEASAAAMNELMKKFPSSDGWRDHKIAYLVIPRDLIIDLAAKFASYEQK